ncbi:MAG TPA: glycosyltransferase family 2 protein [Candidatus Kapabacteria bacterium]|jgi:glycosyltransferase involved in cell wall biosynthesis|nr:glycosyltransferase family 2 protein [Candidatus Kapabacteria bacterium]HPU22960.1 glycosyltransferase family 2 protein [Candidatus Kapabacteria bacterium]
MENRNNANRKENTKKEKATLKETQNQKRHQQNQQNQQNQQKNARNELLISVVIPLYNEEESIPELALQLEKELQELTHGRYEVIFVDDGSTDGSLDYIKQIHRRNKRFRYISFRRNYGKSAALAVGFEAARGKFVATMDADLQDDPAEIKNLAKKMKEGFDLVTGWKQQRKDPISKTIPSKLFNFVTSLVSGIKLHDFNCGLKLYRKSVTDTLQVYGEMHRYLPALAHWEGFRVAEIPVVHHARRYGKSKFGLSRFINGFLDLLTFVFITRFMKRPMHFFGLFGTIFTLIGFAINAYLTVEWFLGNTYLSNRPLANFGIALIIVGVQFFSIGLVGEMIVKQNFEKTKNYSIKEKL